MCIILAMESGSCRCHTSSFSTLGLEHCDFNTKLNKWLKIFIKFIFKSITHLNFGYFNFEQIFFKRALNFLLQKKHFCKCTEVRRPLRLHCESIALND